MNPSTSLAIIERINRIEYYHNECRAALKEANRQCTIAAEHSLTVQQLESELKALMSGKFCCDKPTCASSMTPPFAGLTCGNCGKDCKKCGEE
jgi:hypothetical protein